MPRNGSGVYTLPAGNPVVDGTVIETTWANPTMADIAVQLNNVLTRDGLLGPTVPLLGVDGSAALPGYSFAAQNTSGIFRDGTQVGISYAGVARAGFGTLGSTFYGTLGNVNVNANGDQLSFSKNGFNYITASGAGATLQIQAPGAGGTLRFSTNAADRVFVDQNGNVGIGAGSLAQIFEVTKNLNGVMAQVLRNTDVGGSAAAVFQFANSGIKYVNMTANFGANTWAIQGTSTINSAFNDFDTQSWRTNAGVERMRMTGTVVNIGPFATPVTGTRLQVTDNAAARTFVNNLSDVGSLILAGPASTSELALGYTGGGGGGAAIGLGRGTSWDTSLKFYTNAIGNAVAGGMTERMIIASDGNIGMGGVASGSYRLRVAGGFNNVAEFFHGTAASFGSIVVSSNDRSFTIGQRSSTHASGDLSYLFNAAATPFAIFLNSVERFRMDATGIITLANATTQALTDITTKLATTAYAQAVSAKIQPITASVAANALTVTLNPTVLDFRSATLTSGAVSSVANAAAISVVVPSGATLGTVSAVQSRVLVVAINNAGTTELAVVNVAGGVDLDESGVISTTAISGASNAANVVYSTTARANVAYRLVGEVVSTQAVAGTWASAPSLIQGGGGNALAANQSLGMGQVWTDVTGSRALGTTYYNTTERPINCAVLGNPAAGGNTLSPRVNGTQIGMTNQSASTETMHVSWVVPPGCSYSCVTSGVTLVNWFELR